MIPFSSFLNWIAALVVGAFGIILYLGSKQKATRAYAYVAFAAQLWAIGIGAYFYTESSQWIVFWNQYNHFIGGLIAVFFYLFTILYPDGEMPSRRTIISLGVLEAVLFYLYFFTHIAITDKDYSTFVHIDRFDLFHQVGPIFYASFGTLFALSFINLLLKKSKHPEYENELSLILYGTILGFMPAVTVEMLLPFAGYYGLYSIGPALALGWVAFLLYSIAKHRILNIRLAFAEVSVLVMSVILFANIFLSEEATFGILGRIGIFIAFGIVGAFFIRNIIKKEEQKEQLASVTRELQKLNGSLEEQVEVRTRELSGEKVHSETIIESLTNGLVEYTTDFKVIRINKAAEELLGISRERIVGRKITPSDSTVPELEALALVTFPILSTTDQKPTAAATGISYAVNELSLRGLHPRELQTVTAPIIGERGETAGFLKILRDVTGEKKISREKSEFISIAAHQLRTPLSGTKWSLNVMLGGDRGVLLPEQKNALTRAQETNEKMIGLVNDLLSAARIEDGRFGYSFEDVDVVPLIETTLSDSTENAREKGLIISFDKQPTTPKIFADADKLSLALHNLVENAVHYTNKGGHITVALANNETDLIIRVSDNGMGIKQSDIEQLFTKFFRAENAKRTRSDGTGLGLFIVRNIVARHGGTITVQSKENTGTTFEIHLPLDREKVPEAEETIYY